jgi:hypothetical protein
MECVVLVLGRGPGGLELSAGLAEVFDGDLELVLTDRAEAFVFGFSEAIAPDKSVFGTSRFGPRSDPQMDRGANRPPAHGRHPEAEHSHRSPSRMTMAAPSGCAEGKVGEGATEKASDGAGRHRVLWEHPGSVFIGILVDHDDDAERQ